MSYLSRSIDNFQLLTNTNLGLEETRAETSEHAIQANLDAYIASAAAATVATASATSSTNSATSSALSTLSSSIASLQAQAAADEGKSTAEINRAEAAEGVLTTAVSAEASRAQAVEATHTAGIASNSASISTNSTAIASLVASRTTDEAHIVSNTSSIQSLHGSQVVDEAAISAEISRATAAENVNSSNIATNSSGIASLQSAVTALTTNVSTTALSVSGAVTAGSVVTSMITNSGPVSLVSQANNSEAYAKLQVQFAGLVGGLLLDVSQAPNPDVADFCMYTVDDQFRMRYEKRGVYMQQPLNGAGQSSEVSIRTGSGGAGGGTALFYSGYTESGFPQGNLKVANTIVAGALNTSNINYSGPLTISSTGDQYGSAKLVLANVSGSDGLTIDTSGSQYDNSDVVLKRNTANVIIRSTSSTQCDSANGPSGEFQIITSDATQAYVYTLYSGTTSSGVAIGNFKVNTGSISAPTGIVSDSNDHDTTLSGSWNNFSDAPAAMRLVRKGSQVTVTLSPFIVQAESNTKISTYSNSVPAWAIPAFPVECCIVIATNGMRSNGCCMLNAQNAFCLLPFNGNWGGYGGINQCTSFSYLI